MTHIYNYNENLFVYGTLKSAGDLPHPLLRDSGKYLGDHITDPRFKLFDLGPFPAVVPVMMGGYPITGEVYAIHSLDEFDWYEGYPTLYNRIRIPSPYGDCWVYVYNNSDDLVGKRELVTGIW